MTFRPAITSQSDLERAWLHAVSPLGFSGHSVWLMLIDADDRPLPNLTEIADAVDVPDADQVDRLADFLRMLLEGLLPGGRVAFLRSRPGRDGVNATDRAFASALYAATVAAGLAVEVVHLATDVALTPIPLDDVQLATAR